MTDALARQDKEAIFKVWLYNLVFEYLPDKQQSEPDHYNKLYLATTSTLI